MLICLFLFSNNLDLDARIAVINLFQVELSHETTYDTKVLRLFTFSDLVLAFLRFTPVSIACR